VVVDAFLRSKTNRRIFAGGDTNGIRQLSPVASYGGRIIAQDVSLHTADMSKWLVYSIAGRADRTCARISETKSGKILGAQLFGATASENIHFFALAIQRRVTADHLKEMAHAYPTFASTFQSLFA